MSRTLVDANVWLDVFTEDERWFEWSARALAEAADAGRLVINPIVYAEISVRFSRIEDLEEALGDDVQREALPWSGGFLAGKVHLQCRARGGKARSPLPDFYIGAHAAVCGMALLTRDASRYRTSFDDSLAIVSPR